MVEAVAAAEAAAGGRMDGFVEGIAQRLGAMASAAAVFGAPVTQGEVTVIPVAKVRWGFGGGGGSGMGGGRKKGSEDSDAPAEMGSGSGGGGGVQATPVGFIEVQASGARFVRTESSTAGVWPVVLASAFAFWMVARALRALFR
jgi:uncharacterized spore protein YtfJ